MRTVSWSGARRQESTSAFGSGSNDSGRQVEQVGHRCGRPLYRGTVNFGRGGPREWQQRRQSRVTRRRGSRRGQPRRLRCYGGAILSGALERLNAVSFPLLGSNSGVDLWQPGGELLDRARPLSFSAFMPSLKSFPSRSWRSELLLPDLLCMSRAVLTSALTHPMLKPFCHSSAKSPVLRRVYHLVVQNERPGLVLGRVSPSGFPSATLSGTRRQGLYLDVLSWAANAKPVPHDPFR